MNKVEQLASDLIKELRKFDCIKSCRIHFSNSFFALYNINKTILVVHNDAENDFKHTLIQALLIETNIKHSEMIDIRSLLEIFYRKYRQMDHVIKKPYNQNYAYKKHKEIV